MRITAKRLAEIAEKNAGYSVTLASGDGELTNIRFRRNANGRRNRSIVEADCSHPRVPCCVWDSDTVLTIED